jgi:virginiamycin B lyase
MHDRIKRGWRLKSRLRACGHQTRLRGFPPPPWAASSLEGWGVRAGTVEREVRGAAENAETRFPQAPVAEGRLGGEAPGRDFNRRGAGRRALRPGAAVLLMMCLLLAACASTPSAGGQQTNASNLPYNVTVTSIREFPVLTPQSGLMRPAVDNAGNIWFGEMTGNRLGRLNPKTGQVDEWKPPNGDGGIMGIAVDRQNHIWFAEQEAGYIGEVFTDTSPPTFKTYPTPRRPDGGPSGPNDLAFDQSGNLWFTESVDDRVGRLDVATGHIQEYPLVGSDPKHSLGPWGLAIDAKGNVWVSELSGGKLVRLDPATGAQQSYTPPTANANLMEVAAAPDGSIWFAEYLNGKIGRLDPASGTIREYAVPSIISGTPASGVYGLVIDSTGAVWFTDVGDNAVGRFQPAGEQFTFYPIPTAQSVPYGITLDSARNVWFTEGSANAVGMLAGTSV